VKRLQRIDVSEKNQKILKIFRILVRKEKQITNTQIKEILEYIKYKLSVEYYR